MKQIIVVTPNSISTEGKNLLLKEGIILIEHEDPTKVRVINNIDGFEGDDIFNCLVDAISGTTNTTLTRELLGRNLINTLLKRRSK